MHDGKAGPWRVTPPEAVAYLFELGSSVRETGPPHRGESTEKGRRPPEAARAEKY